MKIQIHYLFIYIKAERKKKYFIPINYENITFYINGPKTFHAKNCALNVYRR